MPFLLRWNEPVDTAALTRALRAVLDRHDVLRSLYRLKDGQPTQYVTGPAGVVVEVVDLSAATFAAQQLAADVEARVRQPFDLATEVPVRCTAWTGGAPQTSAVLLTLHHIAVDGWSTSVLFDDLDAAYTAALAAAEPPWPPLPLQYADFATWERQPDNGSATARLAARVAQLEGLPATLTLGYRDPAPAPVGARRGDQVVFELPELLRAAIHDFARTLRATPFAVLLAVYEVLLQRWSGLADFLVGTVTANRAHPAVEQLIGFFVNTVPLRATLRPTQTFRELCREVRGEAFRALEYQRIPFQHLSAAMGAAAALVQVGFALQNMPTGQANRRWQAPIQVPTGTAKFDLFLICEEGPDGIVGILEYDLDVYPSSLANRFAEQYPVLLSAALAAPDTPINRLPLTEARFGMLPPCVLVGAERDLVAARARRIGVAA